MRRAVVRVGGETIVGTPKSDAGTRDIAIPPHLMPLIKEHLKKHVEPGKDTLLFPGADGGHLNPSTLYGRKPTRKNPGYGFYAARVAADRPDLRWHDLRHTGAVLSASTGATLAELMGRLGHSTPGRRSGISTPPRGGTWKSRRVCRRSWGSETRSECAGRSRPAVRSGDSGPSPASSAARPAVRTRRSRRV